MEYLSYQAAADLLKLILLSQFAGLTSFDETMERLSALHAMCSPNNATRAVVAGILEVNSWANGHYWEEGEKEFKRDGPVHGTLRPPIDSDSDSDSDPESDSDTLGGKEPDFLNFCPASRTGLGKWEFRPQDADPHPSVPHGHWEGRSRPKLDPYQGWIYEGKKKQTSRESKDKIKALWNDRIFRKFALDTIRYHLQAFPYHGDWRVENPLHLPRRR
jgi:hypothetical protein